MGHYQGRINEIRLDAGRQREALISCPAEAVPKAGQYLLAFDLDDAEAVLGHALFISEKSVHGFWTAAPIPVNWEPGTSLDLAGPLGHGFELPREVHRLGLVTLGNTVSRLMPLVSIFRRSHGGVTLFTDLPLPRMPALLEAYPLATLGEMLDWPDFLAIDLPVEKLPQLSSLLRLSDGLNLIYPAQVLITSPMPCVGLAHCGVCAVPGRRGWKYACEDGPVFELCQLKW
jgi:hypothetical protein